MVGSVFIHETYVECVTPPPSAPSAIRPLSLLLSLLWSLQHWLYCSVERATQPPLSLVVSPTLDCLTSSTTSSLNSGHWCLSTVSELLPASSLQRNLSNTPTQYTRMKGLHWPWNHYVHLYRYDLLWKKINYLYYYLETENYTHIFNLRFHLIRM